MKMVLVRKTRSTVCEYLTDAWKCVKIKNCRICPIDTNSRRKDNIEYLINSSDKLTINRTFEPIILENTDVRVSSRWLKTTLSRKEMILRIWKHQLFSKLGFTGFFMDVCWRHNWWRYQPMFLNSERSRRSMVPMLSQHNARCSNCSKPIFWTVPWRLNFVSNICFWNLEFWQSCIDLNKLEP